MSNAAKHRKKAAEFEQLKQIDRAIASYIRSIEESESAGEDVDVALLNKVGDLTLRQGRVSDAVTYYERAVEHYATAGLFNNAIALCNKILRSAPGRANVYFTLGRICAKKGLRGDATRNFLAYATRMQQEGRVDEGMRALSEVADLMPELTEVRRLVEEHATRVGIALPRKKTPAQSQTAQEPARVARPNDKSSELVFLDLGPAVNTARNTPPLAPRIPTPAKSMAATVGRSGSASAGTGFSKSPSSGSQSLEDFMLFDPSKPEDFESAESFEPLVEPTLAVSDLEPTSDESSYSSDPSTSLLAPETHDLSDAGTLDVGDSPLPVETAFESVDDSALVSPLADLIEAEVATSETLVIESALDEPLAHVELEDSHDLSAAPESELVTPSESIPYIDYAEPADAVEEPASFTESVDARPLLVESSDNIHVTHEIDDVIALSEVVYVIASESDVGSGVSALEAEHEAVEAELTPILDAVVAEVVEETPAQSSLESAVVWLDTESPPTEIVEFGDALVEVPTESEIDGFELVTDFSETGIAPLPDISFEEDIQDVESHTGSPTGMTPSNSHEAISVSTDASWLESSFVAELASADSEPSAAPDPIDDLVVEDFSSVADEEYVAPIGGLNAETRDPGILSRSLTPISVSPIPELEAAIEAGALAVAEAEADPEILLRRPPFRLDPHDFILPGELPPLTLDDRFVDDGLARLLEAPIDGTAQPTAATTPVTSSLAIAHPITAPLVGVDSSAATVERNLENARLGDSSSADASDVDASADHVSLDDANLDDSLDEQPLVTPAYTIAIDDELASVALNATTDEGAIDELAVGGAEATDADASSDQAMATEAAEALATEAAAEEALRREVEASLRSTPLQPTPRAVIAITPTPWNARAVTTTPSLPIAAVAADASVVATSRRDELRAAVARSPQDSILRRRLAEALFESGEREAGLTELQTSLSGFSQRGMLGEASDIADELVHISPDRIQYHQKRVELAVRLNNQPRLQTAYLDLADTLVRTGDEVRAHAVYARVLEIDPWDERARAALGSAAPPPPPKPSSDGDFVNLADWLREDVPATTRMRMPEPTVSGDEQADFDALLRHFKEGVSRSLGEEDYESHYDLGVAYKEMGLLDDAIAEFQKALRSRRHRLPAYEALGQCFVEQSRHSVAATVLTRALHEPGLGDEHRVGVLYLLAYSCEALQRWDEARSYYSRVYATDINFRDVAARVAALDQIAQ